MKEKFRKEIERIDKQISKLYKERNLVKAELQQYRISIKDYILGTELIPLPNSTISVDYILDSDFEEVYIPKYEGVFIQSGRLDCSSYSWGTLYYSEVDNSYIHTYHGNEEKIDIKYIFLKEKY